jgi:hypothetical protein
VAIAVLDDGLVFHEPIIDLYSMVSDTILEGGVGLCIDPVEVGLIDKRFSSGSPAVHGETCHSWCDRTGSCSVLC